MSADLRGVWSIGLHEAIHEAQHMLRGRGRGEGIYYVRGNTYHYTSPYEIKGEVVNVKVN